MILGILYRTTRQGTELLWRNDGVQGWVCSPLGHHHRATEWGCWKRIVWCWKVIHIFISLQSVEIILYTSHGNQKCGMLQLFSFNIFQLSCSKLHFKCLSIAVMIQPELVAVKSCILDVTVLVVRLLLPVSQWLLQLCTANLPVKYSGTLVR